MVHFFHWLTLTKTKQNITEEYASFLIKIINKEKWIIITL